jgi:hypothetical protein
MKFTENWSPEICLFRTPDVAKALGIHKATVSKARKQAIDGGLLTPYNKLTQPGFLAVSG